LTGRAESTGMSRMEFGPECRHKLAEALARTSRELVALDAEVVNAALAHASVADLKAWLRDARGAEGFFAEVTRLIEQRLSRRGAPAW
jgi:hypothetical protein